MKAIYNFILSLHKLDILNNRQKIYLLINTFQYPELLQILLKEISRFIDAVYNITIQNTIEIEDENNIILDFIGYKVNDKLSININKNNTIISFQSPMFIDYLNNLCNFNLLNIPYSKYTFISHSIPFIYYTDQYRERYGEIILYDYKNKDRNVFSINNDTYYYKPVITSTKYTRGVLHIIAGSNKYIGALYMSIGGAIKGYAGVITCTPLKDNKVMILNKYPQIIMKLLCDVKPTSILIGPGIDESLSGEELISIFNQYKTIPIILDADGINILIKIIESSIDIIRNLEYLILTPNIYEFKRLNNKIHNILNKEINECSLKNIKTISQFLECNIILKGYHHLICIYKKHNCILYTNDRSNTYLSIAGTGDIYSGYLSSNFAIFNNREKNMTVEDIIIKSSKGYIYSSGFKKLSIQDLIERL